MASTSPERESSTTFLSQSSTQERLTCALHELDALLGQIANLRDTRRGPNKELLEDLKHDALVKEELIGFLQHRVRYEPNAIVSDTAGTPSAIPSASHMHPFNGSARMPSDLPKFHPGKSTPPF
jgi:hypothetical protein